LGQSAPEAARGHEPIHSATDLPAEIEGASPPFDASEWELENPIERIKADVLPPWLQQPERAACASNRPATADVPAKIERAYPSFDASEIAAEQGLESAIERIEAEDWLQQLERAVCASNCPTMAELPAEIERAFPPFGALEIIAAGPESAIERIEAKAIPDWLRQPGPANDYPATAANQNEDSPGPLKRLWTRVTGRSAGSHIAPPGQDTWLTDLLEGASDQADNDEEHDFAPKRARSQ
jgi:hypothetical protein